MTYAVHHMLAVALITVTIYNADARDLFVNPTTGTDNSSGLSEALSNGNGPVKTIARAIKLSGPGDTIHLAPLVYRESAIFSNRSGEEGKPIILDGHGATLDGSDPLNPADWTQISPGLYRNDHLIKMQDFILTRWFFIFGDKMNHMGRTSKGTKAPLKKPEDLEADEWTYIDAENAFYIRVLDGKKLEDRRISAPIRSVGVGFGGKCEHIVIRNLTATHVYNDGFNIHGYTRDLLFENIRSIECGDDGFSAHDDCTLRVDGFTSIGNSTGICNIGNSRSDNNRVLIKDCLAYDLFFLDGGRHSVTNSMILASSQNAVVVSGRTKENLQCTLNLENVLICRETPHGSVEVGKGGVLDINHVTVRGLQIHVAGTATLKSSVVHGTPEPRIIVTADAKWTANDNLYDIHSIQVGKTTYLENKFSDYQHATGQDAGTKWPYDEPDKAGADVTKLPKLP